MVVLLVVALKAQSFFGVAQRRLEIEQILNIPPPYEIPAGIPYAMCASSDEARPDGDL